MSTEDINKLVHDFTLQNGAIPAPLDYNGFPKSVCTSVNNEVCHGIPSKDIILKDGDIINVDVSTKWIYSDASRMFMIGNVNENAKKLVQVTKECVQKGLEVAKPWGFLGDIGDAINSYAKKNGYSVVREIGGHGVGLSFHEPVSYVSGTEMLLVPGMIFTIEPMVNEGTHEIFVDEEYLSAQWECMVLVTETGVEILTE
ncbi:methionine aminopeptidase, type I [Clostridioides difficile DA00165]|nr:methionine aminopeptidase, type I [Clostridioides difficile DA00165]